MNRLRCIELTGFRGALGPGHNRFPCRFPEHGTVRGKCGRKKHDHRRCRMVLFGQIDHLWREDCKAAALRNTLLPTGLPSKVRIAFSDSNLESTKALSEELYASQSNKTTEFKTYLSQSVQGGERLFFLEMPICSASS